MPIARANYWIALFVLLLAVSATAQKPEKRANELYNEGKDLMSAGDLEGALAKFDEAWGFFQHGLIVKKRGEVKEQLRRYEGAVSDYQLYLQKLSSSKRKERKLILERISKLQKLLLLPVPTTVVCDRTGVRVSIDRAPAQRTPFDLKLVPGNHTAEVKDKRFEPFQKTVRIVPGDPQLIKLKATPRTGAVVVMTDRDTLRNTVIAIDNRRIELTAAQKAGQRVSVEDIVVGKHTLVCTMPGRPSYYVEFKVVQGAENTVLCDFSKVATPADPIRDPWGWTTAAIGLAGVATGVGLIISWRADVAFAEDTNQDLVTNKDIIGFTALGLGVAAGVASYFVFVREGAGAQADAHLSDPVIVILPTSGGGMAGATWRF